jgi:hypothetical protein
MYTYVQKVVAELNMRVIYLLFQHLLNHFNLIGFLQVFFLRKYWISLTNGLGFLQTKMGLGHVTNSLLLDLPLKQCLPGQNTSFQKLEYPGLEKPRCDKLGDTREWLYF